MKGIAGRGGRGTDCIRIVTERTIWLNVCRRYDSQRHCFPSFLSTTQPHCGQGRVDLSLILNKLKCYVETQTTGFCGQVFAVHLREQP